LREAAGVVGVEAAIRVDADLHVRSYRLAHRPDAPLVFRDHLGQGTRFIASLQAVVADRHLQPREPSCRPFAGRSHQLIAVEESEAEGRIGGNPIAAAAQQSPERQVERPCLDIPDRKIDCGDGMHRVAALSTGRQQPVQLFPDPFMRHRVHADQGRCRNLVDRGSDHFLFGDGGETGADQAAVGFETNQHTREVGALGGGTRVQGHLEVQRDGTAFGNLHDDLLGWFAVRSPRSSPACWAAGRRTD
jgi:hypothetical protein